MTDKDKRRRKEINQKLQAIYDKLPTVDCKGLCADNCTAVGFEAAETFNVEDAGLTLPVLHMQDWTVRCSWLDQDTDRCTHHKHRPLICRMYGVTTSEVDIYCKYGCKITGKPINPRMLTDLMREVRGLHPTAVYLNAAQIDPFMVKNRLQGHPYWWIGNEEARSKKWDRRYVLGDPDCSQCNDPDNLPSHYGSITCESGSIASGGTRSHCTCDFCF